MATRSDGLSEQRDRRAHEEDASAEDAYDVPQEQQNDALHVRTCEEARTGVRRPQPRERHYREVGACIV